MLFRSVYNDEDSVGDRFLQSDRDSVADSFADVVDGVGYGDAFADAIAYSDGV